MGLIRWMIMTLSILAAFSAQAKNALPVYTDEAQPIIVTAYAPTFEIQQAANPTTGYSWQIRAYDTRLLKLVAMHYQKPVRQLAGTGGYTHWLFTVLPKAFEKSRTTPIVLVYAKPFAPLDNPRTVVFNVKIQA